MKKNIILTLLFAIVVSFGQKSTVKYLSIDTEIDKLSDLTNRLNEIEISLDSSTGNLAILEAEVTARKKKTQETATKIAKLNTSREKLEK